MRYPIVVAIVVAAVTVEAAPAGKVRVINISASEDVLFQRLSSRGRESDEEIRQRIRRAFEVTPRGEHVVEILNEGTIEEGVDALLSVLKGL